MEGEGKLTFIGGLSDVILIKHLQKHHFEFIHSDAYMS